VQITADNLLAFDFETHRIADGLLAPPGVCGSFADREGEALLRFDESLDALADLLRTPGLFLATANGSFDFAVACARRPDLIDAVFEKHERGEVFDVLIGAALDAVAGGHLFKDPRTGGRLRHPATGAEVKRYSLEVVSALVLGRWNAKENDEYRLRYAELEHLPIEEWPPVAVQYPKDDARNTFDVALALATQGKNQGSIDGRTWTHHTHQARAALAMHLGSVWGMRTDPERVGKLAKELQARHGAEFGRYVEAGFYRPDGSRDTAAIKRAVIAAYTNGQAPACVTCGGTGKVPSEKNPRSKVNCKACGGAGLAIPDTVPRTDKDGIATDRDTLAESGDDTLEGFAAVSKTDKLLNTYLPFLQAGTKAPISVWSNVLVESGRASYDGLLQLLPRGSGIRECFVAREGYVYCSVDYAALELCTLAQVCLWLLGHSTMAEVINATGDPGSLHTRLGAKLAGMPFEQFAALVKAGDKDARNKRWMAKAANFGFPGLMGPPKFVLAKRKEGLRLCITAGTAPVCSCGAACPKCHGAKPDTECEVPHCRRCHGRGALCGVEKITEWYGRAIAPTCARCTEVAVDLRRSYYEEWPEIPEYFEWVKCHDGIEDQLASIVSPGTGYLRGGLNASALANHSFQSLAGFGAKHALWKVSRECYTDRASPLFGSRPMVFAHDEIISELIETRAHEAANRQAAVMISAMREFVPDVTIRAEPAIARRWFKDMEPIFDEVTGRLIPWTPELAAERKRKAKAAAKGAA
jgi:hypothetical protein